MLSSVSDRASGRDSLRASRRGLSSVVRPWELHDLPFRDEQRPAHFLVEIAGAHSERVQMQPGRIRGYGIRFAGIRAGRQFRTLTAHAGALHVVRRLRARAVHAPSLFRTVYARRRTSGDA